MSRNIFGFAHSHVGKIVATCEAEIGRNKLQILSSRELPANRRVYVAVGVATLDKIRRQHLARCRATLVVIDALPALQRIADIRILDATDDELWLPRRPLFGALLRSLRADPRYLDVKIDEDTTIARLIADIKSRGILGKVLIAAKAMKPEERTVLHKCIARFVVGEISLVTLQKRAIDKRGNTSLNDELVKSLKSDVVVRLRKALLAFRGGSDAILLAAEHKVDAAEIRFLANHLKEGKS